MLRIHFTSADLARTRVAGTPDPMWELALSIHVLRVRGADPLLAGWKKNVISRLRPGDPLRDEVALLLALNPPVGYFPDFLTPAEATDGFDVGLNAVLSTPRSRLRHEIDALGDTQGPLSAVADLGAGRLSAVNELGHALTRFHEVAIAPMWDRVRVAFDADRRLRGRTLLDGGPQALLDGLHPTVRFAGDILEIVDYPSERDLHLDGRGLVLVPSYFKSASKPLALVDPELPPVLVYSVHRAAGAGAVVGHEPLVALLGRTRAAVVELVAEGSTTSELARRLGVSAAAVSQHVAVLREAGLLTSTRDRNMVQHMLTPLGYAMLAGG